MGLATAAVGSVIGAGFASGREVCGFFTRYGAWSFFALLTAISMIAWCALHLLSAERADGMPEKWQGRWPGKLWQAMFLALMLTTGGAMTASLGEIGALSLPLHWARWWTMALSLALCWLLAGRELRALRPISRALIVCLLICMALAWTKPRTSGAIVARRPNAFFAAFSGLCYGGFNMALAAPVLCGRKLSAAEQRVCAIKLTLMLGALLLSANMLMLRHPDLISEPLPLLRLMASFGRAGYALCVCAMGLAVFTTQLSAMTGMLSLLPGRKRYAGVAAMAVMAVCGFERLVNVAYPLLGGACFLLLVAAVLSKKCVGFRDHFIKRPHDR